MFKLDNNYKVLTDSESEDDIANQKRKSLIFLEQSLDLPCDVSPLEPRSIRDAEKPGQNIEKLLMERVMLRKELRLRSVQEMLVDTSHKLEQAETKIQEYETLPLFRQYLALSSLIRLTQDAGTGGAQLIKSSLDASASCVYQLFLAAIGLPVYLFHQLPASVQLLCVSLVAHLATTVGESAENYSNECRERSVTVDQDQPVTRPVTRRQRNRRS